MAYTAVQLCLLADYQLEEGNLASRVPMLQEYQMNTGLRRMPDGTYNRLVFISPDNSRRYMKCVYVITMVYEKEGYCVHWTESMSYTDIWLEDHLSKINLLINDCDHYVLGRDSAAVEDRASMLDYFF
jgi:hypothetical protein